MVFCSDDRKELIVTCKCGCQDSIHIKVDKESPDYYCLVTYMNGNLSRDQGDKIHRTIGRKLKKIWSIIRNKDYYYSDIIMRKSDYKIFKNYINEIE